MRLEYPGEMRLATEPMLVGHFSNVQASALPAAQHLERALQTLFQNETMGLGVFQGEEPCQVSRRNAGLSRHTLTTQRRVG